MADNDELFFSFDDEEEDILDEQSADSSSSGAGNNRIFLIGVIVLAFISLAGIAVIALFFLRGSGPEEAAVSANEMTNQAIMTLAAQTADAQVLTASAPTATTEPVEEPTDEPVVEPSITPTSPLLITPTSEDVAEVAEVEPDADSPTPGEIIAEDGEVVTPTPLPTSTPAQSSIIEVTPLGGGDEEETPEAIGGATGEDDSGGGAVSEDGSAVADDGQGGGSTGGPAIVATLPDTGFTGTAGLAGAGILAMVLVVVVVAVRRIRIN